MTWRQKATDTLTDVLRFASRAAILVSGIVITIAAMYIVSKLCWFFVQFLDRTVFSEPW